LAFPQRRSFRWGNQAQDGVKSSGWENANPTYEKQAQLLAPSFLCADYGWGQTVGLGERQPDLQKASAAFGPIILYADAMVKSSGWENANPTYKKQV